MQQKNMQNYDEFCQQQRDYNYVLCEESTKSLMILFKGGEAP